MKAIRVFTFKDFENRRRWQGAKLVDYAYTVQELDNVILSQPNKILGYRDENDDRRLLESAKRHLSMGSQ